MRQRWKAKPLPALGILVALLLLVGLLWGVVRAARSVGHLTRLRAHLWTLEEMAGKGMAAQLSPELARQMRKEMTGARAELQALKATLGPAIPLLSRLGWMPRFGGDLASLPHLLEAADRSLRAGNLLAQGIEPLTYAWERETISRRPDQTPTQALLPPLVDGRPLFLEAQGELNRALEARGRIQEARLSPSLSRRVDGLDRLLGLLHFSNQAALSLPKLLGQGGPIRYLLLLQNDFERRATGGFISGVGLLVMEEGKIAQLDFQDSYTVDDLSKPHPLPPPPLTRYMGIELWVLRDANWSPDFPTSARQAMELYQLDQGIEVDGVIAVDLIALQSLLQALGPIYVPEYQERVTQDNVLAKMEEYWASPEGRGQTGQWWERRKDFSGAVMKATIQSLLSTPRKDTLLEALRVLGQTLAERHLLAYLHGSPLQEALAASAWDGAVRSIPGDYLLVVDSNMGYNKVDPKVERNIAYRLQLRPDAPSTAQLTLTYHNRSRKPVQRCVLEPRYAPTYAEMMEGCYWNYMRVYVPQGSKLLGANIPTESAPASAEAGRTSYASYFILAPGERQELLYQYELPASLSLLLGAGEYRLLIQKQAGTTRTPVEVEILLPERMKLAEARPAPHRLEGHILGYSLLLTQDQAIYLRLEGERRVSPAGLALALAGGLAFLWVGLATRRRRRREEGK